MDKALAAVAAVRNAIIDTVNACAIPSGGCLHVAALRGHLGPLPVRASDFTDALSSLVQTGVFRTRVDREGLLLELTESGAALVYAPPSLPRPSDWIEAFRQMRSQRDILRRPAANDGLRFVRRMDDRTGPRAVVG